MVEAAEPIKKRPRFLIAAFRRIILGALILLPRYISVQASDPESKPPEVRVPDSFVVVQGVKLHYLDWGGIGDVLLLLTGFGDSAGVFRDFAPAFTNQFRVLALTRRGFSKSEKPETGYDLATRIEDIRNFLSGLGIERAHIAGHSLAGDEMTLLAGRYPQLVNKLVYLDAVGDRSAASVRKMLKSTGDAPPFFRRLLAEVVNDPAASGITVSNMPPPEVWNIMKSVIKASADFSPDYASIKAATLVLLPGGHSGKTGEAAPKDAETTTTENAPRQRKDIEIFKSLVPHAEVVEIKGGTHYLFRGPAREEVASRIIKFLTE